MNYRDLLSIIPKDIVVNYIFPYLYEPKYIATRPTIGLYLIGFLLKN